MDAFEELFRLHQRAVYGWILRIVRNPAAAEDLTVETFWRIYKAHARFEAARGFEPWARRIATRAALDWLRARRPEGELTAEVLAAQTTGRLPIPASRRRFARRPRRPSRVCRPAAGRGHARRLSRSSRTKKWPRRSESQSRP